MVGLDDALDDREAQPGARGVDVRQRDLRGAGTGAAVADVEDPLARLVGDASAAVGDGQLDAVRHRAGLDVDGAVGGGVADAVDDQVGQDAGEPGGVRLDLEAVGDLAAEGDAAGPGHRVGGGDRLADQVAQHDQLRCDGELAGVDAGELEEVVDHAHHPVDLPADLAVVARRVGSHPVLQRLGHHPDPGQRRAQVVRDPRHELAARLLQAMLAVAGLGESLVGRGQLGGELVELARPTTLGDDRAPVTDTSHVLAQGARPAHEGGGEHQGHEQRDDRGCGGDDQHDLTVVVVDEHPARDHLHGQEDGQRRDDADDRELPAQRPVAQGPARGQAQDADREPAADRHHPDLGEVTHLDSSGVGGRGSQR